MTRAVPLYYNPAYAAAAHAFPTTRKARWIADSLATRPIPHIELREPVPLTASQIAGVHDPAYLLAVETGQPRQLAESQGLPWDKGLWPMVCTSNGGIVAAALAALEHGIAGSLSSGLHHARRKRGAGYCTFNGLVLAAQAAVAAGAKSVLILDVDAHGGGGTFSLIDDDLAICQIDISVDAYDGYQPNERTSYDLVTTAETYLPTIERRLQECESQRFDLCIHNAGMDPHEDCPEGGLPGISEAVLRQREMLVFEWCRRRRLPVAFSMAGGYTGPRLDEGRLVELHRLTLQAAAAY
ncbi:MAG: hypothetical protein K2R98_22870 [Gemmataceae bacterium]|nr:hypothetical protein [Gemmataceae bacterium]